MVKDRVITAWDAVEAMRNAHDHETADALEMMLIKVGPPRPWRWQPTAVTWACIGFTLGLAL